jgi:integrase
VSSSYSCCARPHASHGHPFLVFDCQGHLHLPLTVFAKEAQTRLAPSSVKKYLTQILAFFSWLETDPWQVKANHRWTDEPVVLRDVIREYLVSRLQCRTKSRQDGGEWIEAREESLNPVRHLLSGLKLFYRIAKAQSYYQYTNPLAGPLMEPLTAAHEQLAKDTDGSLRLKMPDQSGIDAPRRSGRLTDCYFILLDKWVPQVVTDVTLPNTIRRGGQLLNERRRAQGKRGTAWGLREECVVSLLFETGARVSEILTLTLDDWNSRGLKDTAWARNKGSRKRYAKYIRFSQQTIKLLTRYFNTERRAIDPHHYTLDDYLHLAQHKEIDLKTVPLFLSQRGTPWTVESFRANYWKKACAAARVDMDLHQCRHWYVNQALIEIHEQARKGKMTVERGEEELIAYMHWRSGEKVLKAYNHYYQPANHAAVQNSVFKKLRSFPSKSSLTTQRRKRKQEVSQATSVVRQDVVQESVPPPQTGAALYAFLTGKGGFTDDLIADLLATD